MTTAVTDLATWPQMPPFKQPTPEERPPRSFSFAVFLSVVIHAFLAFLLWVMVTNHVLVEPIPPPVDSPLTVTLVSLPTPADPAMPRTSPPERLLEPVPEQIIKAETDVISKDQAVPDSEVPEEKPLVKEDPTPVYLEDTNPVAQDDERLSKSVFEAASVLWSKDQELPGLEDLEGKPLGTDRISSFDLEGSYDIAREVGRMSMSEYEVQESRYKLRELYLKNRFGIVFKPLPDCRTFYSSMGYLAIPFLLKDTITDSGCTWEKDAVLKGPSGGETERYKDEERLDTYRSTINESLFSVE